RNRLNLAEPARPSDSRTRSSLGTPAGRFLGSVKSLYTSQLRPHGRHGGCSSAGRASGCGPEGRGFKSRHSHGFRHQHFDAESGLLFMFTLVMAKFRLVGLWFIVSFIMMYIAMI